MKKVKILLTASGAPGSSTLIRKLKDNGERKIEIIATDMNRDVIGRFWADKFYTVPPADHPEYIPTIKEIILKEQPQVLFPVSSAEVLPIAKNKSIIENLGTKVMVSDLEPLETAINKYRLYSLLKAHNIPVPEFYYPKNLDEFIKMAKWLGYPSQKVCFKPHVSKGSRGFRILDETVSRRDLLLKYKPDSRYMSLEEFIEIFKEEKNFPDLILMEFVEGFEYDAMTLCHSGRALLTTVKTREQSRWGVVTVAELINKPEIVELVDRIISLVPLSFNIGLQFIGNKLIEINPRVSTFIYQSDLNEPYLAIKLLLDEISNKEVRNYQAKIKYGRRMIRYMDQIFWDKDSGLWES